MENTTVKAVNKVFRREPYSVRSGNFVEVMVKKFS